MVMQNGDIKVSQLFNQEVLILNLKNTTRTMKYFCN